MAVTWYRKAADEGHILSQYSMASAYSNGEGVVKDLKQSRRWMEKAAEGGNRTAMHHLGMFHLRGDGGPPDLPLALVWLKKAANEGNVTSQNMLGHIYSGKEGVRPDPAESYRWFAMGAARDDAFCQFMLGVAHATGAGVDRDQVKGLRLLRSSADLGYAGAQVALAYCYGSADGVPLDTEEAYYWMKLAVNQGDPRALRLIKEPLFATLSSRKISELDARAKAFKSRQALQGAPLALPLSAPAEDEALLGTGFFISSSGHVVTSYHLVKDAKVIVVGRTDAEAAPAKVFAVVKDHDLVILKVDKRNHECLPVASSFDVKLGATVATVGFPNVAIQGVSPKLAKGEVSSLAGFDDDPRLFQVNVPIQPGNGGGALVDARGNVVGIICAKLALPSADGVHATYALKSSVLLNLIETVPGLREQLPSPHQKPRSFEDAVADAERAAAMVIVK
jgi:hypothetical protein